jgi:hypothetical protein
VSPEGYLPIRQFLPRKRVLSYKQIEKFSHLPKSSVSWFINYMFYFTLESVSITWQLIQLFGSGTLFTEVFK